MILFQFERVNISLTGSVVSGQFQMWDDYQEETLALIPFVRMMSTTSESDNACYFYNRTDSKGIRFISHHYDLESERHVDSEIDPISSAFIRLEDDGI
jgi:aromatic ring hydroxylase